MSKLRSRIAVYVVASLFFTGAFVVIRNCFVTLQLNSRYAGVLYFGEAISVGRKQKPEDVIRYAQSAMTVVPSGICRSDILKAGLAIVLKRLEIRETREQHEPWFSAVTDADQYLIHSINCLPTDGDLWLRMAMVSRDIAEDPIRLAQLLGRSQKLAPAEISVVAARLSFYNLLGSSSLSSASESVKADLELGLVHEPRLVRDILQTPSKPLIPYINSAIAVSGFECKDRWALCRAGVY